MAKSSGDRDSGLWREGVCGILALLLLLMELLSAATNLQGGQTASPRGRGVLDYPRVGNNETWKDLGDALAMPCASSDLRISLNIDPEGQYNVPLVDQLPAIQDPIENIDADNATADEADLDMWLVVAEVVNLPRQIERDEANMMVRRPQVPSSVAESGVSPSSLVDDVAAGVDQLPAIQDPLENIDADNAAADEADLDMWLVVAEVASLPRQIERDEANMMVRHPQVPSSVAESGVSPSSLVDDVAARAPQHLSPQAPVPETVASVLPQRIEDEAHSEVQVEVKVAIEAFPPGMLELISDVARLPQFATASMAVPAGDLESNLEERIPVDHPEAGDSSADLQAEINIQDDVENLEIEEPHAKGMQ